MIAARQLIYELQLRLNKVASNTHQAIPDEDLLVIINGGQNRLMLKRAEAIDKDKLATADLQDLMVHMEELSITTAAGLYPAAVADLSTTKKTFFLPMEAGGVAKRECCSEHPFAVTDFVRHGDLSSTFSSSHTAPSFKWHETVGQISGGKLYCYTGDPEGEFEVQKLYLSYLRHPEKIDLAGYIHLNGDASVDQDCELPSHLKEELLDFALIEAAAQTENIPALQAMDLRTQQH